MCRRLLALSLVGALAACGDTGNDDNAPSNDAEPDASVSPDGTGADGTESDGSEGADVEPSDDASTDVDDDPSLREGPVQVLASRQPETCPDLTGSSATWSAGGVERTVDLYFPSDGIDGAAITFLWHGAGDRPGNFARAVDAQRLVDTYDTVLVVPHAQGTLPIEWAIFRAEDKTSDAAVFDHVSACLVAEHGADARRIYTTGFSAGGMWSTWLTLNRADTLAASVLFSGGTSRQFVNWAEPGRAIPVLAIHGGETDVVAAVARFEEMTLDLTANLAERGHVVVECDHGSGHTIPFSPYSFAFPFLYDIYFGDPGPRSLPPGGSWPPICSVREAQSPG